MAKVEIIKAKKNGDYDFSIIHKKKKFVAMHGSVLIVMNN